MSNKKDYVLIVSGNDVIKVASALSSSLRFKILCLVNEKGALDIEQLSKELGKSKADVSTHIRLLERAGLLRTSYISGKRGVKKICNSGVKMVRLLLRC